ncbi:MAG: alcohol dehydrogenase catalytic domain-containing protein [Clostridia bacterium]
MKAVVFSRVGGWCIKEIEAAPLREGEVRLSIARCGVCMTDLHIYRGDFPAAFPVVPGHEFAGTVLELGPGVEGYAQGDRVVVDPNISCLECTMCRSGRPNLCPQLRGYGTSLPGGFQEVVSVRAENIYRIGDLPFSRAVFAEPLACILHGLDEIGARPGETALLVGAGPIGLMFLEVLKAVGIPEVTVVDMDVERLARAERLGASSCVLGRCGGHDLESLSREYDVAIDATGNPAVVEWLVESALPGRRVLVFGVHPQGARVSVSPYHIYRHEIEIKGCFAACNTMHRAVRMLQQNTIAVDRLISHELALDEFGSALSLVGKPKTMKVHVITSDAE